MNEKIDFVGKEHLNIAISDTRYRQVREIPVQRDQGQMKRMTFGVKVMVTDKERPDPSVDQTMESYFHDLSTNLKTTGAADGGICTSVN